MFVLPYMGIGAERLHKTLIFSVLSFFAFEDTLLLNESGRYKNFSVF